MANGSPFALNLILILFLFIPGYAVLQGWLNSTVQLDTISRLDKILITVSGGGVLLIMMLLLNRFNIFEVILCNYGGFCDPVAVAYDTDSKISVTDIGDFSILSILSFVVIQSSLGYILSYLLGTFLRIQSDSRPTAEKDLEQPLETAIEQSTLGEKVWIITNTGDKITGKLYRIGSPSKDKDIFVSGATRKNKNEDDDSDGEKIGLTYIDYENIAQIQFPDMVPQKDGPESNFFLRWYNKAVGFLSTCYHEFWVGFYCGIFTTNSVSERLCQRVVRLREKPKNAVKTLWATAPLDIFSLIRSQNPIVRAELLSRYLDKKKR